MHEHRGPGNPAALFDKVFRRQLAQKFSSAGGIPIDLLTVRAGRHDDLALYSRPCAAGSVRIWIVERRPELIATSFEQHRMARHFADFNAFKISDDRSVGRHLRHRSMVGPVPCRVFARVTGLAGVGRRVATVGNLNGSVADVPFSDGGSERHEHAHREEARGDHADDERNRRSSIGEIVEPYGFQGARWMMPRRIATFTAAVRSLTLSFVRMLLTCT